MLISSPPTASRRKRAATSPAPNPYLQPQTQITHHASSGNAGAPAYQQKDDLFDLFAIMDNTPSTTEATPVQKTVNNNQTNDNGFEDLFADFNSAFSAAPVKAQPKKPVVEQQPKPSNSKSDELSSLKTITRPRHRSRPQKEEEQEPVYTRPSSKSEITPHSNLYASKNLKTRSPSKNGHPVKKKKMKKIDVLPLLHKGIRANKFKLNGSKSKVRKFFVTENNYFFCWDAVNNSSNNYPSSKKNSNNSSSSADSGKTNAKTGFFSKITGGGNKSSAKVDTNRSIPIRSIRSLVKNAAYTMQTYNFIPPSQKSLTISIVYVQNGSEKRLNFMNYEAFHNVLFFEGLTQLWDASKNPNRNLSEVFELYVDFSKDILPKHLRPQKFKWEPLGAGDYNSTSAGEDNGNTLNPFFDNSGAHRNVNLFDPTNNKSRARLKSF